MGDTTNIAVTLKKSPIGTTERQRATLRGLGLRRIGETRTLERTESVLGMIDKVRHLVDVGS